jgi:hypothetical protein
MHPRGSPEAPLEPRRKVGPSGPIKTFYKKKKKKKEAHLGEYDPGRMKFTVYSIITRAHARWTIPPPQMYWGGGVVRRV